MEHGLYEGKTYPIEARREKDLATISFAPASKNLNFCVAQRCKIKATPFTTFLSPPAKIQKQ
jgi:hypothetical protein